MVEATGSWTLLAIGSKNDIFIVSDGYASKIQMSNVGAAVGSARVPFTTGSCEALLTVDSRSAANFIFSDITKNGGLEEPYVRPGIYLR